MTQRPLHKPSFLAAYRELANLSQEDAAERLGVSDGHLSKIENGKRPWSQEIMEKASALYGVSIADLIERDPRTPDPTRSIVATIDRLSPDMQRKALKLLATLIDEDDGDFRGELPAKKGASFRAPTRRTKAAPRLNANVIVQLSSWRSSRRSE